MGNLGFLVPTENKEDFNIDFIEKYFNSSVKLIRNNEIIGGYFVRDLTLEDVDGEGIEGVEIQ